MWLHEGSPLASGPARLLVWVMSRDRADEREEIEDYISDHGRPDDAVLPSFTEAPGRPPVGLARGWARRAERARSCDRCGGDLWVETPDGTVERCGCRAEKAIRRSRRRLAREHWLEGPSLNLDRPPLSYLTSDVRNAVEKHLKTARDISPLVPRPNLWIVGPTQAGKSSICSFFAQQLGDRAIARHSGDMLAGFRLSVARDGESKAEEEIEELVTVPLLIIDDLDRPAPSREPISPFTMRSSCASYDLLRLAGILRDRTAAERPTIVTSRCAPSVCVDRTLSIARNDLVRALLSVATGGVDPIEDFPNYLEASVMGAFAGLASEAQVVNLAQVKKLRAA
jgi:hypothetical protein